MQISWKPSMKKGRSRKSTKKIPKVSRQSFDNVQKNDIHSSLVTNMRQSYDLKGAVQEAESRDKSFLHWDYREVVGGTPTVGKTKKERKFRKSLKIKRLKNTWMPQAIQKRERKYAACNIRCLALIKQAKAFIQDAKIFLETSFAGTKDTKVVSNAYARATDFVERAEKRLKRSAPIESSDGMKKFIARLHEISRKSVDAAQKYMQVAKQESQRLEDEYNERVRQTELLRINMKSKIDQYMSIMENKVREINLLSPEILCESSEINNAKKIFDEAIDNFTSAINGPFDISTKASGETAFKNVHDLRKYTFVCMQKAVHLFDKSIVLNKGIIAAWLPSLSKCQDHLQDTLINSKSFELCKVHINSTDFQQRRKIHGIDYLTSLMKYARKLASSAQKSIMSEYGPPFRSIKKYVDIVSKVETIYDTSMKTFQLLHKIINSGKCADEYFTRVLTSAGLHRDYNAHQILQAWRSSLQSLIHFNKKLPSIDAFLKQNHDESLNVGSIVCRGSGWDAKNMHDGGAGHLGTVWDIDEKGKIKVSWHFFRQRNLPNEQVDWSGDTSSDHSQKELQKITITEYANYIRKCTNLLDKVTNLTHVNSCLLGCRVISMTISNTYGTIIDEDSYDGWINVLWDGSAAPVACRWTNNSDCGGLFVLPVGCIILDTSINDHLKIIANDTTNRSIEQMPPTKCSITAKNMESKAVRQFILPDDMSKIIPLSYPEVYSGARVALVDEHEKSKQHLGTLMEMSTQKNVVHVAWDMYIDKCREKDMKLVKYDWNFCEEKNKTNLQFHSGMIVKFPTRRGQVLKGRIEDIAADGLVTTKWNKSPKRYMGKKMKGKLPWGTTNKYYWDVFKHFREPIRVLPKKEVLQIAIKPRNDVLNRRNWQISCTFQKICDFRQKQDIYCFQILDELQYQYDFLNMLYLQLDKKSYVLRFQKEKNNLMETKYNAIRRKYLSTILKVISCDDIQALAKESSEIFTMAQSCECMMSYNVSKINKLAQNVSISENIDINDLDDRDVIDKHLKQCESYYVLNISKISKTLLDLGEFIDAKCDMMIQRQKIIMQSVATNKSADEKIAEIRNRSFLKYVTMSILEHILTGCKKLNEIILTCKDLDSSCPNDIQKKSIELISRAETSIEHANVLRAHIFSLDLTANYQGWNMQGMHILTCMAKALYTIVYPRFQRYYNDIVQHMNLNKETKDIDKSKDAVDCFTHAFINLRVLFETFKDECFSLIQDKSRNNEEIFEAVKEILKYIEIRSILLDCFDDCLSNQIDLDNANLAEELFVKVSLSSNGLKQMKRVREALLVLHRFFPKPLLEENKADKYTRMSQEKVLSHLTESSRRSRVVEIVAEIIEIENCFLRSSLKKDAKQRASLIRDVLQPILVYLQEIHAYMSNSNMPYDIVPSFEKAVKKRKLHILKWKDLLHETIDVLSLGTEQNVHLFLLERESQVLEIVHGVKSLGPIMFSLLKEFLKRKEIGTSLSNYREKVKIWENKLEDFKNSIDKMDCARVFGESICHVLDEGLADIDVRHTDKGFKKLDIECQKLDFRSILLKLDLSEAKLHSDNFNYSNEIMLYLNEVHGRCKDRYDVLPHFLVMQKQIVATRCNIENIKEGLFKANLLKIQKYMMHKELFSYVQAVNECYEDSFLCLDILSGVQFYKIIHGLFRRKSSEFQKSAKVHLEIEVNEELSKIFKVCFPEAFGNKIIKCLSNEVVSLSLEIWIEEREKTKRMKVEDIAVKKHIADTKIVNKIINITCASSALCFESKFALNFLTKNVDAVMDRLHEKIKFESDRRDCIMTDMQRIFRGYVGRQKAKREWNARFLQSVWRGFIDRKFALSKKKSILTLQRISRGYLGRRYVKQYKHSLLYLQKILRGCVYRRQFIQQKVRALCAQKIFRGYKDREFVAQKKDAIISLQRIYRGYMDRKYLSNLHNCATMVQKWFRGYRCRIFEKKRNVASNLIQKNFRGYLGRKLVSHRTSSIVNLQRVFRGYIAQRVADTRRHASTTITKICRGCSVRLKFSRKRIHCIILQAIFRSFCARSNARRRSIAIQTIQKIYRGYLGKNIAKSRTAAILTSQRVFRGYRGRKRATLYKNKNFSAALIQKYMRMHLVKSKKYYYPTFEAIRKSWCVAVATRNKQKIPEWKSGFVEEIIIEKCKYKIKLQNSCSLCVYGHNTMIRPQFEKGQVVIVNCKDDGGKHWWEKSTVFSVNMANEFPNKSTYTVVFHGVAWCAETLTFSRSEKKGVIDVVASCSNIRPFEFDEAPMSTLSVILPLGEYFNSSHWGVGKLSKKRDVQDFTNSESKHIFFDEKRVGDGTLKSKNLSLYPPSFILQQISVGEIVFLLSISDQGRASYDLGINIKQSVEHGGCCNVLCFNSEAGLPTANMSGTCRIEKNVPYGRVARQYRLRKLHIGCMVHLKQNVLSKFYSEEKINRKSICCSGYVTGYGVDFFSYNVALRSGRLLKNINHDLLVRGYEKNVDVIAADIDNEKWIYGFANNTRKLSDGEFEQMSLTDFKQKTYDVPGYLVWGIRSLNPARPPRVGESVKVHYGNAWHPALIEKQFEFKKDEYEVKFKVRLSSLDHVRRLHHPSIEVGISKTDTNLSVGQLVSIKDYHGKYCDARVLSNYDYNCDPNQYHKCPGNEVEIILWDSDDKAARNFGAPTIKHPMVSTVVPNIEDFQGGTIVSFFHEQQYGIGEIVSGKEENDIYHKEYVTCKYIGLWNIVKMQSFVSLHNLCKVSEKLPITISRNTVRKHFSIGSYVLAFSTATKSWKYGVVVQNTNPALCVIAPPNSLMENSFFSEKTWFIRNSKPFYMIGTLVDVEIYLGENDGTKISRGIVTDIKVTEEGMVYDVNIQGESVSVKENYVYDCLDLGHSVSVYHVNLGDWIEGLVVHSHDPSNIEQQYREYDILLGPNHQNQILKKYPRGLLVPRTFQHYQTSDQIITLFEKQVSKGKIKRVVKAEDDPFRIKSQIAVQFKKIGKQNIYTYNCIRYFKKKDCVRAYLPQYESWYIGTIIDVSESELDSAESIHKANIVYKVKFINEEVYDVQYWQIVSIKRKDIDAAMKMFAPCQVLEDSIKNKLYSAISKKDVKLTEELIKSLTQEDIQNHSLLSEAIRTSSMELVELFLAKGANPLYYNPVSGMTPFLLACKLGKFDIAFCFSEVCQGYIDFNSSNLDESALLLALKHHLQCEHDDTELLQWLLVSGADIFLEGSDISPLRIVSNFSPNISILVQFLTSLDNFSHCALEMANIAVSAAILGDFDVLQVLHKFNDEWLYMLNVNNESANIIVEEMYGLTMEEALNIPVNVHEIQDQSKLYEFSETVYDFIDSEYVDTENIFRLIELFTPKEKDVHALDEIVGKEYMMRYCKEIFHSLLQFSSTSNSLYGEFETLNFKHFEKNPDRLLRVKWLMENIGTIILDIEDAESLNHDSGSSQGSYDQSYVQSQNESSMSDESSFNGGVYSENMAGKVQHSMSSGESISSSDDGTGNESLDKPQTRYQNSLSESTDDDTSSYSSNFKDDIASLNSTESDNSEESNEKVITSNENENQHVENEVKDNVITSPQIMQADESRDSHSSDSESMNSHSSDSEISQGSNQIESTTESAVSDQNSEVSLGFGDDLDNSDVKLEKEQHEETGTKYNSGHAHSDESYEEVEKESYDSDVSYTDDEQSLVSGEIPVQQNDSIKEEEESETIDDDENESERNDEVSDSDSSVDSFHEDLHEAIDGYFEDINNVSSEESGISSEESATS